MSVLMCQRCWDRGCTGALGRGGQIFSNKVMILILMSLQEGFKEEVTLSEAETKAHQTFRAGRACLKEGAV